MDSQFNCLTNRENMCPSKIFKHTLTKLKSIVRIPQEKATALSTDREEKATASVSLRGGVPTLEATGRGQLLHVNFSKDAPNITFFFLKTGRRFSEVNEALSGPGAENATVLQYVLYRRAEKARRRTQSYRRLKVCRKRISNG
jgi:hypothetical protein